MELGDVILRSPRGEFVKIENHSALPCIQFSDFGSSAIDGMFHQFDGNGDGHLDLEEMNAFLRAIGASQFCSEKAYLEVIQEEKLQCACPPDTQTNILHTHPLPLLVCVAHGQTMILCRLTPPRFCV